MVFSSIICLVCVIADAASVQISFVNLETYYLINQSHFILNVTVSIIALAGVVESKLLLTLYLTFIGA